MAGRSHSDGFASLAYLDVAARDGPKNDALNDGGL